MDDCTVNELALKENMLLTVKENMLLTRQQHYTDKTSINEAYMFEQTQCSTGYILSQTSHFTYQRRELYNVTKEV